MSAWFRRGVCARLYTVKEFVGKNKRHIEGDMISVVNGCDEWNGLKQMLLPPCSRWGLMAMLIPVRHYSKALMCPVTDRLERTCLIIFRLTSVELLLLGKGLGQANLIDGDKSTLSEIFPLRSGLMCLGKYKMPWFFNDGDKARFENMICDQDAEVKGYAGAMR